MTTFKSNWLKILVFVILQTLAMLTVFYPYPAISMLFLGEGGDSLLYSEGNSVAWIVLPLVSPQLLNFYRIQTARKDDDSVKVKVYITISVVTFTIYAAFIMHWAINNGFRI
ncbi:hypothetical protein [Mucilaginibacter sp. HD30]